MVSLCANRPGLFGPHSAIHPRLPTTCFLDMWVIPLATWIYLLTSPILIFCIAKNFRGIHGNGKTQVTTRTRTQGILVTAYYFLLLAMLAMVSLEIARLDIAKLGIGLLPFTYVGVIVAGIVHTFIKKRMSVVRWLSALYWLMLAAAMALKVAALKEEEGAHNRIGIASKYPLGDEVTDLSVMLGVEIVLAFLEVST